MFYKKKHLLPGALLAVATMAFGHTAGTLRADNVPTDTLADTLRTDSRPAATAADTLHIEDITAQVNYGHRRANRTAADVDIIVIHSNYHMPDFCEPRDTFSTEGCIAQFRHYNTAAHYMVCRDARILRMVKEKDVAWQAGRSRLPGTDRTMLNPVSIGIEVVSTKTNGPTEAQYRALIALVLDICSRYDIHYIVRHADIAPDRRDDPWGFDWLWFADQIQKTYPNIEIPRTQVQEVDVLR